jgi:Ca-activated chloride channel family protein
VRDPRSLNVKYLVLSCIVVGAVVSLEAQQPTDSAGQSVFRSGASLVALNVTVTGPDKRPVAGLGVDDFAVYEDGVRQQVSFFESAAVPIDLILLIDTSSSMYDKIELVQKAGLGVIQTLRQGDRAAIVGFNDTVNIVQPLTGDREVLQTAIRQTRGKGGTALHNAIYVSLKQFGRSARGADGDVRRQAIAVLSDGEDTASMIQFEDVMSTAQKSGVSIYPIAMQSESAMARQAMVGTKRYFSETQYSMRKLAQETGAQAFFPNTTAELQGIYAAIGHELSSQYSIGYSPTNGRSDGRYRRIQVRVTSHPELQPRARSGYLAESPRATASFEQPPLR